MSKKLIISISIIAALVILSVWAFGVSSEITSKLEMAQEQNHNVEEKVNVEELIITETREGKKFWEVYATSGRYENDSNQAILSDIIGNFYKDNKVVMSFKAPKALYNEKKKEIILSGGAYAATADKINIFSNNLKWSSNKDEIYANGNVKIKKDNDFISTGDGSVFNTDFTKFKISGNSQTNVYLKQR